MFKFLVPSTFMNRNCIDLDSITRIHNYIKMNSKKKSV